MRRACEKKIAMQDYLKGFQLFRYLIIKMHLMITQLELKAPAIKIQMKIV